jgi:hypothetical protein
MTKYICGLFDFYTEEPAGLVELEGVNNTKDAVSMFIDKFRNSSIAGNTYWLCVTSEHKSNMMVYKMTCKLNSNGKLVTSVIPMKTLEKEKVDVLVSRTLQPS